MYNLSEASGFNKRNLKEKETVPRNSQNPLDFRRGEIFVIKYYSSFEPIVK